MGWFGIVSIITSIARQTAYDVETGKMNRYGRKHPTAEGTYRDARGVERRLDNNHIVERHSYTGDQIIEDIQTGEKVNLTLLKLDEEIANAKRFGKTVAAYGGNTHAHEAIEGKRFIDVENGRLYVIRQLSGDFPNGRYGHMLFLVDASTGKLVRKTDGQMVKDNVPKQMIRKYPQIEAKVKRQYNYLDPVETTEFITRWNTDPAYKAKFNVMTMNEDKSY